MNANTRAACLVALAASGLLAGCEDTRKALGLTKNPPDEFQVVGRAPLSIPPDFQLRPPTPGAARPQEQTATQAARSAVLGVGNGGTATAPAPAPRPTDNPQTASTAPITEPPAPAPAPRTPVAAGSLGAPTPAIPVSAPAPGVLGRAQPQQAAAAPAAPAQASVQGASVQGASVQGASVQGASAQGAAAQGQVPSSGEQALLSRLGADKALPNIRAVLTEELTKLAEANETMIDKVLWWRKPEAKPNVLDAAKESQRLQENAALGKPVTDGESPSIKRVGKAIFEGWF